MQKKTLALQFMTDQDKTFTLSIDAPVEPVNEALVNQVMDTIIAEKFITTTTGFLKAKKGAQIIDRSVVEITVTP
ncbi:DUF2922 domain-containing protein [Massilibacterium senegalense]|uniref:DUF2922 domain-containing protein n=1 Tax=Massilibacterium senegalense TaxID=1632858 RepID=UPI000780F5B9|nr:DUF2922 domain-containing protein [Massilibacterium senegalense]